MATRSPHTVLFALCLLASGAFGRTVFPAYPVFREAVEGYESIPRWIASSRASTHDLLGVYDRGQEMLMALGLLPTDAAAGLALPAPVPLGTTGPFDPSEVEGDFERPPTNAHQDYILAAKGYSGYSAIPLAARGVLRPVHVIRAVPVAEPTAEAVAVPVPVPVAEPTQVIQRVYHVMPPPVIHKVYTPPPVVTRVVRPVVFSPPAPSVKVLVTPTTAPLPVDGLLVHRSPLKVAVPSHVTNVYNVLMHPNRPLMSPAPGAVLESAPSPPPPPPPPPHSPYSMRAAYGPHFADMANPDLALLTNLPQKEVADVTLAPAGESLEEAITRTDS